MIGLKEIETKGGYARYQRRVRIFMAAEKIEVHSAKCDTDGDALDPSFSWYACECCMRHLGGNRHTIVAGPRKGEKHEYDVCVDCYYYLEYGKRDDATMLRIEEA